MVKASVPKTNYSETNGSMHGVEVSNAWWGLDDDGSLFEGAKGLTKRSSQWAFGWDDRVSFTLDTGTGTMHFSRNGKLLKGAEASGIPLDEPLYPVACPFGLGSSVQLSGLAS
jgi:hypothetical protein